MKKIYTLILFAGISANLNAQLTDKSDRPFIEKTIPYTHAISAERMSSPDTTGIVNYNDFAPQFAPTGGTILYRYTWGGYVFGNNRDSINVCAQGYMNLNPTPTRILGVLLWFRVKKSDAGSAPNSKVVVKAWGVSPNHAYNTDGSGTFNTTVLNFPGPNTSNSAPDATADLLFSNIDTTYSHFNYVSFADAPVYAGDFAVGVDFSTLAAGDTAGLLSDPKGSAGNLDYSFHFYKNKWVVTDQLFSRAGVPDFGTGALDNNIAIWAVIDEAKCYSHYITTYDSVLNTFSLNVDPLTPTFATSYHWDFGDGSTSTLPSPTHIYAIDSLYNVCLKTFTASGDSCEYCHTIGIDPSGKVIRTGGFKLDVINPATVSVKEIANESTITISPNPFNTQTTITFSDEQNKTTIILTDILGKEIRSTTFSGKQYIIEKGEMKPGIYFVKTINAEKHICNSKIIVQ
jgi:hypothetical protein